MLSLANKRDDFMSLEIDGRGHRDRSGAFRRLITSAVGQVTFARLA